MRKPQVFATWGFFFGCEVVWSEPQMQTGGIKPPVAVRTLMLRLGSHVRVTQLLCLIRFHFLADPFTDLLVKGGIAHRRIANGTKGDDVRMRNTGLSHTRCSHGALLSEIRARRPFCVLVRKHTKDASPGSPGGPCCRFLSTAIWRAPPMP